MENITVNVGVERSSHESQTLSEHADQTAALHLHRSTVLQTRLKKEPMEHLRL
jgi:hypothetical protein